MAEKAYDYNEINELIKEYFSYHGMETALNNFKAEEANRAFALQQSGSKSKQLNKAPTVRK